MNTTIHIKFTVLIIRMIITGITGFFRNTFKSIQFIKATSVLTEWPEYTIMPFAIAAIENK